MLNLKKIYFHWKFYFQLPLLFKCHCIFLTRLRSNEENVSPLIQCREIVQFHGEFCHRLARFSAGKCPWFDDWSFFILTWLRLRLAGYRRKTSVTLERERDFRDEGNASDWHALWHSLGRGVAKRTDRNPRRRFEKNGRNRFDRGNRPDVEFRSTMLRLSPCFTLWSNTLFYSAKNGHARDFWGFV